MRLLQDLATRHGVTLITPNWNPYHQSIDSPIAINQLIRHILGDYQHQAGRTAPVCRGQSLTNIISMTHQQGFGVYSEGDTTSGAVNSPELLHTLGNSLLPIAQYHILALIHLYTSQGQEHDSVVIMSDGTNLWFGSQNLGAYHSISMVHTVNFLKEALELLQRLFKVEHFTTVSRFKS